MFAAAAAAAAAVTAWLCGCYGPDGRPMKRGGGGDSHTLGEPWASANMSGDRIGQAQI